jgi:hypothetical protein
MKKILFTLEEQTQSQTQTEDKPVKNTFGTSILIENQSVMTPFKGGIELQIHHRFSLINNVHDLYGIYGAANTRLGLNYGITDKIMVGIGLTKDEKALDLQGKYVIFRQTKSNSMPISLTYYGNIAANLIDTASGAFGPTGSGRFKEIHRLSYFNQLIVARKFSDKLSLQIAPSFFYFNSVKRGYKSANFAVSVGGRYKVASSHSVIFEYDQLLSKQDSISGSDGLTTTKQPNPNITVGWEIGTATHSFQIFATNYRKILNQQNLLFNTNDFKKRKYLFGFNITVRF